MVVVPAADKAEDAGDEAHGGANPRTRDNPLDLFAGAAYTVRENKLPFNIPGIG